jgi:hypothetical protein
MRWLLLLPILCLAACNQGKIAQLEKENKGLSEGLGRLEANSRQGAALEVQARCAKQAEVVYEGYQFSTERSVYVNHYNPKLDRCFVEVTDTEDKDGNLTVFKELVDAFEGKDYGDYFWANTKRQAEPSMCKVTTPDGQEVYCHSEDEFESLVKKYME